MYSDSPVYSSPFTVQGVFAVDSESTCTADTAFLSVAWPSSRGRQAGRAGMYMYGCNGWSGELRKNSVGCDFSGCSECQCNKGMEGDKGLDSQFNVELMEPAAALCWVVVMIWKK